MQAGLRSEEPWSPSHRWAKTSTSWNEAKLANY